jgi:succinate dehydrogenase / fumarate reductase flavoprotein subunit
MNTDLFTPGDKVVDTKAPTGPIETRWDTRKFEAKLVNPANRRKHRIIVVGTGLAGGSAGATLAEQGYQVVQFCFQDSPRRAHSVAAQGGINAAKNYRNDGDSVYRLFYDTVKGGDFRSRESSTSASRRACPSPVSTAACSTPVPSAVCRSSAPSTPAARPASSC